MYTRRVSTRTWIARIQHLATILYNFLQLTFRNHISRTCSCMISNRNSEQNHSAAVSIMRLWTRKCRNAQPKIGSLAFSIEIKSLKKHNDPVTHCPRSMTTSCATSYLLIILKLNVEVQTPLKWIKQTLTVDYVKRVSWTSWGSGCPKNLQILVPGDKTRRPLICFLRRNPWLPSHEDSWMFRNGGCTSTSSSAISR